MLPSDGPSSSDWQSLLESLCKGFQQQRCLSTRNGRSVLLILDGTGQRRIFKFIWNIDPGKCLQWERSLELVQSLGPGMNLMPILRHGRHGRFAWIEMPVADDEDSQPCSFDHYSPRQILPVHPGTLSAEEVATIGLGITEALIGLASAGLMHGDVKPSNLLSLQGSWLLSDFDTVRPPNDSSPDTASTPGYQPPGRTSGPAQDTYALGKVLYELWTGNSRLEYPTIPRQMLTKKVWNRRDRLLNRTIHALCALVGSTRLSDLPTLKSILEAIASPAEAGMSRAERMIPGNHLRVDVLWFAMAVSVAVSVAVSALAVPSFNRLPKGSTKVQLGDQDLILTRYQHLEGINGGSFNRIQDDTTRSWSVFNVHGSIPEPLQPGDRVEIEFQKHIWRGHVALYLAASPYHRAKGALFGHRENFGGMEHLMWFHLDGDELVAPTVFRDATPRTLGSDHWTLHVATNSLAIYQVILHVDADEYRWQVHLGDSILATGQHPAWWSTPYLGIYVFDNTQCALRRIRITREATQPPPPGIRDAGTDHRSR